MRTINHVRDIGGRKKTAVESEKTDFMLAIDTSARSGSVSIVDTEDGSLVAERTVGNAGPHARWLLRSISALLEDCGICHSDIDQYAVAVGPGSFTGLRIGITTIKGLAWPLGRPVYAVSTLKALAMNAPFCGPAICPVLDARKSEVYTAIYASESGRMRELMGPSAIRPEALVRRLEELVQRDREVVFLGSGLSVYGGFLKKALPGAILAPEPLWHIRASNIAALASEEGALITTPLAVAPLYLRMSEAELKRRASGGS